MTDFILPSPLGLIPLTYFVCCGVISLFKSNKSRWNIGVIGSGGAFAITVFLSAQQIFTTRGSNNNEVNGVTLTALLLITLLGFLIQRFSRTYLDGEPDQRRYLTSLLLTLGSVSVVVTTDHLAVLAVGWSAVGFGLHFLLTFYSERRSAQVAAHKKFILSRCADLCLIVAMLLIFSEIGSLSISEINNYAAAAAQLSWKMQFASAIIVLAVLLKTAQLPFHGWLIQVMEAPTPVSALLHAGVINIGGLVLIKLSVLLSSAPVAQGLLVIVGAGTAVLAGAVMMTRISIKVKLAWSTCAQMGFMIMECGLGLYDLAFLHLVAHSIYKAYLFLSAGETVRLARIESLVTSSNATGGNGLVRSILALPLSVCVVVLSAMTHLRFSDQAMPWLPIALLSIGLAPLFWGESQKGTISHLISAAGIGVISQLYFLWHSAFGYLIPANQIEAPLLLQILVIFQFLLLYFLQAVVSFAPNSSYLERLYTWAYAGFYLDEIFNRFTYNLWPPNVAPRLSVKTIVKKGA